MATSCEHLEGLTAAEFPAPRTPDACEECLVEKTRWVALRECQTCGHVSRCDFLTETRRSTSVEYVIFHLLLYSLRVIASKQPITNKEMR